MLLFSQSLCSTNEFLSLIANEKYNTSLVCDLSQPNIPHLTSTSQWFHIWHPPDNDFTFDIHQTMISHWTSKYVLALRMRWPCVMSMRKYRRVRLHIRPLNDVIHSMAVAYLFWQLWFAITAFRFWTNICPLRRVALNTVPMRLEISRLINGIGRLYSPATFAKEEGIMGQSIQ